MKEDRKQWTVQRQSHHHVLSDERHLASPPDAGPLKLVQQQKRARNHSVSSLHSAWNFYDLNSSITRDPGLKRVGTVLLNYLIPKT